MILTGKLCFISQDVAEEEIESEMGVVRTQFAYTYQLQGKNDDAQKLYNQVLKSKYVYCLPNSSITKLLHTLSSLIQHVDCKTCCIRHECNNILL